MKCWLLLVGLGALLTAARAELPAVLPADTPTNRPDSGINVPAPLRTDTPTNAVAAVPPAASPASEPYVSGAIQRGAIARIQTPAAGDDCLTFTNGDRFAGAFLGLEDGVIRWRTTADKEPMRFRTATLDELILGAPPRTNPPAPPDWFVLLADGSLLPARQLTVAGDTVTADFAGAGPARLERRQVAALRRCGPGACEPVTFGDAPAHGATNRTTCPQIGYRDTKLPEAVLAEFPWDGDPALPVALNLFVGKAEDLNRPASRLVFSLMFGRANLLWVAADEPSGEVVDMGKFALADGLTNFAGRVVWVGLAFNRKSGEAACYIDGQLRGHTALAKPPRFPDFGIAVTAVARPRLSPRIVLVSPLNENVTLPSLPADRDSVRLTNGDQLVGRLESVSTNEVAFQTPAVGRMVLPLERVAQINFTRGTNAPARAAETRFVLRNGSTLRGAWQRADARTVVVQNSVLGPVALPRDLLTEVTGPLQAGTSARELQRMQAERDSIEQVLLDGWSGADTDSMNPDRLLQFDYRPGTIKFSSGLERHGDLIAITNGIVHWQHPAALDPWAVPLAEVLRVFPPARPWPAHTGAESATVRLGNGDVLSGPLGAAGGETVNVAPWYAGPLAIPRRHVALVTPHPAVTNALESRWTALTPELPAPTTTDSAVWLDLTQPGLRRAGSLPDRVRLDFEAVWPGEDGHVRLSLFQPDDPLLPAHPLLVRVHRGGVVFSADVAGTSVVTNVPAIEGLADLARGGGAQITLFADRTNPSVRVLVDGRPAGEWRGTGGPALTGHGLSIEAGGEKGMALRHIVLREWREEQPVAPAARRVPASPLSPMVARVILHNGDFLTLSDVTADARSVSGKHALLGPVTLNLAAVRALDWGLDWMR